ncbi:hypothetical protein LCGC14_2209550 [marine sediment metagenome]|uniref:Uncharacterized protein n=1 Tax=marine sediment metagenome TaxID=412755 RepID=A0A0F9E1Q7_9ZZZZ
MKLLLCKKCQDVFKLCIGINKYCECEESSGFYEDDGLNVIILGEYAVVIGFNNESLVEAVLNQPDSGLGEEFKAFIIPKQCGTVKHQN